MDGMNRGVIWDAVPAPAWRNWGTPHVYTRIARLRTECNPIPGVNRECCTRYQNINGRPTLVFSSSNIPLEFLRNVQQSNESAVHSSCMMPVPTYRALKCFPIQNAVGAEERRSKREDVWHMQTLWLWSDSLRSGNLDNVSMLTSRALTYDP